MQDVTGERGPGDGLYRRPGVTAPTGGGLLVRRYLTSLKTFGGAPSGLEVNC